MCIAVSEQMDMYVEIVIKDFNPLRCKLYETYVCECIFSKRITRIKWTLFNLPADDESI